MKKLKEKALDSKKSGKLTALKDFVIKQNENYYEIKEGDDLNELGVPTEYHENLKTEKVIK